MMAKKLILVYNASEKLGNKMIDYAHKVFSPSTYACDLCSLTYNNFGMRNEWKKFLETLDVEKEFLYKEGFAHKYPNLAVNQLPIIALETSNNKIEIVLTAEDLSKVKSLTDINHKILEAIG